MGRERLKKLRRFGVVGTRLEAAFTFDLKITVYHTTIWVVFGEKPRVTKNVVLAEDGNTLIKDDPPNGVLRWTDVMRASTEVIPVEIVEWYVSHHQGLIFSALH